MKIGPKQVWQHKTSPTVNLQVIEQVNNKYKVKISGPSKNMHLIEMVSAKYITAHYKYEETIKEKTKGLKEA